MKPATPSIPSPAAQEPLLAYRHCGMEMAEVASMGMEMIAQDYLDVFYDGENLARARARTPRETS